MTRPNPGSDEAIEQGCTCPRYDNHCGKGCYDEGELFWINTKCPVHGIAQNETKMTSDNIYSAKGEE